MKLPDDFSKSMRYLLGDKEFELFLSAMEQEPMTSIRFNETSDDLSTSANSPTADTAEASEVSPVDLSAATSAGHLMATPLEGSVASLADGLTASAQHESALPLAAPVPWCCKGHYLAHRPLFTLDPLFHAGAYYVQEASSMFLEQVLKRYLPDHPVAMLDLCAAPGGKSTHARSLLPEGSLLVSNEVMRNRAQILAENITKWGNADVVVTQSDPADFASLEETFDIMLTDVPCSGEGMFRKDEGAISDWSVENVELCRQRQRRILGDAWPCLKPGGLLIYSTCTYNTDENEENVRWICQTLGAEVLPVEVLPEWQITGNLLADSDFPVYRFLPHRTRGEGLFMAVMRKHDELPLTVSDSFTCQNDGNRWMQMEIEIGDDKKEGVSAEGSRDQERGNRKGKSGKAARLGKSGKPFKSGKPESSRKGEGISREQDKLLRSWLADRAEEYLLMPQGERILAFPARWEPLLQRLKERLYILQAGVAVAEVKGRDWVPCHALAMCTLLRRGAFTEEELPLEQALAYLRKEALQLSSDTARGFVLLTYRQRPLGFVKNLGTRANNLYPQEWRIRTL